MKQLITEHGYRLQWWRGGGGRGGLCGERGGEGQAGAGGGDSVHPAERHPGTDI